ncbi:uncharacterized protein TNCV_355551 [Trichonephila clavipes]|uniref:Transposase n=1 Tax=Trichonephila clavipes TaxID=2585209 RepID=A0A8X7BD36_TRICX|nr:uncharacterized protein TNCV_355551 [Trichonephila clavipes]
MRGNIIGDGCEEIFMLSNNENFHKVQDLGVLGASSLDQNSGNLNDRALFLGIFSEESEISNSMPAGSTGKTALLRDDCHQCLVGVNCDNISCQKDSEPAEGDGFTNAGIWSTVELLQGIQATAGLKMWFLLEGAPAHYSIVVVNHIPITYPRRWIGCDESVARPPRSLDFTPFDFFYWGNLKSLVYKTPVATV